MKKIKSKSKKVLLAVLAAVICAVSIMLMPIKSSNAAQSDQVADMKTCDGLSYFCKTLDSAVDFITGFYETVVVQNLIVEPELFTSNRPGSAGHALHNAWKIFRNLANLVLIVALLLIIISQITGIGISNYGIKKGLPKLIVAVLAVNFSYVLCQACIDLANIVGSGIGNFFEGLLAQATPPGVTLDTNGTWLTTLIVGLGVSAFIGFRTVTVKIIIYALLLLAVVIVAIFMLFVILALRQSLCILLVVMSPIAFVSYMIPGAKSLFDLWKNTMKSVLLAYPICSALVYGGAFAGAIVYSSWATSGRGTEVLRCLEFLVVCTVPYFFIPTIIMKGLGVAESLAQNIKNFASKNTRAFAEGSRIMQSQRMKDQRLGEIRRSGQFLDKNGNLQNRLGHGFRFKTWNSPQSGPFKKIVDARNRAATRLNSVADGNSVVANINRRITRSNRGLAVSHRHAAAAAATAMRRFNKYRVNKKNMMDYDGSGKLQKAFNDKGKFNTPGYYYKNSHGVWVRKQALGFGGKLGYMFHTGIGLRFQNASRFREQYLQAAQDTYSSVEKKAYSDYKRDNLGEGISDKAADLESRVLKGETNKAIVTLSSLLDEGEAGRDQLEAMIDRMAGGNNPANYDEAKKFADQISDGELNKIKKKNPRLWNKIKALQRGDDINDTEVTLKNLDGMSAKQFGEMDSEAQDSVLESLTKLVEDDSNLAAGSMLAVDSQELLTVMALAEGAINDPNVRASLSPQNIARLEHIVELRNSALNKSSAATAKFDAQVIRTSPAGTLAPTDANFETLYLQGLQQAFAPSVPHSGPDNFLQAMQKGDTVRMESIMQSIDRDLDQRMSQAGITDQNERSKRRNSILLQAVRTMASGDGTGTGSGINNGLYSADVDQAIKDGRANNATQAQKDEAEKYLRAREAMDLLEQRYARRLSF